MKRISVSPLFFIIPPVAARVALLAKGLYAMEVPGSVPILLRGFWSDVSIGFMAGLLGYLFKRFKPVFWALWMAWCLLVAFNMDQIRINDANLNYAYSSLLGSRQFLAGCVFTWHHAYHFGLILGFSGLIVLVLIWQRRLPQLTGRGLAITAAVCLSIFFLSPFPLAPYWVQTNLMEENLRRAFKKPSKHPAVYALDPGGGKTFFKKDLSGPQLFPYPSHSQNILLVILENISFDTAFSGKMPYLARLAGRHLSYANFMSLQRQSNRGLYALMCGDFPNFIGLEAKADILVADKTGKRGLLEFLSARGFQTLFMQANETGFFQRDLFCRKLGFQKVLGELDYPGIPPHSGWGLDDQSFFRQALREIDSLNKSSRPWFATLFTGGTHYPFNVPGIFSPNKDQAVTALDRSLSEFLGGLEKQQVLPRTLVIITSDEASESSGRGIQRELRQNHIPLIVMTPQISRSFRPSGLFTQKDLMVSICDYLGLDSSGGMGRSIFRTYQDDPALIFGNVYSSRRYAYLTGGKLYAYSFFNDQWTAYQVPPGGLFTASLRNSLPDENDIEMLGKVFSFNEATFDKQNLRVLYYQSHRTYTGARKLMGSHRVSCRQGDRLLWRLQIESPDPLELKFSVVFRDIPFNYNETTPPIARQVNFPGGQPAIFQYEYDVPKDFDSVNTSIYISPAGGKSYLVKELSMERFPVNGGRKGGER